jgi:hypothetical protein
VVCRVIEKATPGQRFNHPLMGYNNSANTGLADIKEVLTLSLERVRAEKVVDGDK